MQNPRLSCFLTICLWAITATNSYHSYGPVPLQIQNIHLISDSFYDLRIVSVQLLSFFALFEGFVSHRPCPLSPIAGPFLCCKQTTNRSYNILFRLDTVALQSRWLPTCLFPAIYDPLFSAVSHSKLIENCLGKETFRLVSKFNEHYNCGGNNSKLNGIIVGTIMILV